jgi:hypothetical protein
VVECLPSKYKGWVQSTVLPKERGGEEKKEKEKEKEGRVGEKGEEEEKKTERKRLKLYKLWLYWTFLPGKFQTLGFNLEIKYILLNRAHASKNSPGKCEYILN